MITYKLKFENANSLAYAFCKLQGEKCKTCPVRQKLFDEVPKCRCHDYLVDAISFRNPRICDVLGFVIKEEE